MTVTACYIDFTDGSQACITSTDRVRAYVPEHPSIHGATIELDAIPRFLMRPDVALRLEGTTTWLNEEVEELEPWQTADPPQPMSLWVHSRAVVRVNLVYDGDA